MAGNMIGFETLGHSGDPTCVLRIQTDEFHRWYVHLYFGARTNCWDAEIDMDVGRGRNKEDKRRTNCRLPKDQACGK